MARFIDAGPMTFDALVYGRPHPNTTNFFTQQFDQVSNRLTQVGQEFMQGAHEMYDRLSSSRAIEAMRQAARAIKSVWQSDEVRFLDTMEQFQFAPLTMQRFLMAEPTVRQMYIDQTIDGYSDSYVDMNPGAIGEDHYDYRRAMDGLVVESESEAPNDAEWQSVTYLEDLFEGEAELSLAEQVDIQYSWQVLRQHLRARGEDPTSRYGTKMV